MLEVPRTTVEEWVYEGAAPKAQNLDTLNNFIAGVCANHWVIERSNGPLSEGECQRCSEKHGEVAHLRTSLADRLGC